MTRRLPDAGQRRLVVLTGARQTGKTTLVRARYPDLQYINLDAPENRAALRATRTAAWGTTIGAAIFDEAPKEPTVFEKVKYAYDAGELDFSVLSGSSQILLLERIRETLAGRAFLFELWPLMLSELSAAYTEREPTEPPLLAQIVANQQPITASLGKLPTRLLPEREEAARQALDHLLQWGGMPELLHLGDEDRWEWLRSYGHTYLERDLQDLARLTDLEPFRKFQQLTALRTGGLLNYADLARDAGVSSGTARRYMEYLRISYQTLLLQPVMRNLTSSAVKTPKIHWIDVGIIRHLTGRRTGMTGEIFETLIVTEIHKLLETLRLDGELKYYRTRSGMEVDAVINTPAGVIGIEVKYRDRIVAKDHTPLRALGEAYRDEWLGGMIVYTGATIEPAGDPHLWAVPAHRLLG